MENIKELQNSKIIKYFLIIVLGSILLTISSKIKIPFYPVPMTMQTFVVLLLGISFGYKLAVMTVGFYLLEGILGLPVFSNSPEKGLGLVYFTGPTMGYLIGFLFASFFMTGITLFILDLSVTLPSCIGTFKSTRKIILLSVKFKFSSRAFSLLMIYFIFPK